MQFELKSEFDAVLMLTWSDWNSEPRSNRYHFASRFAKQLPVLFFQHHYPDKRNIEVESTEDESIELIHLPRLLSLSIVREIKELLYYRGIKRPLIWIYDPVYYGPLLEQLPTGFKVFHATEDYFTETKHWSGAIHIVKKALIKLFSMVDFMVACSDGVAESCISSGAYTGAYVVSKNGCDAEFFINITSSNRMYRTSDNQPIAIYQGGINKRLDYGLIKELIKKMPDWQFHFCGEVEECYTWRQILKLPNVKYFGLLKPEKIASLMIDAKIGLIPFKQDAWIKTSLPLKAYEYVACGLPVITVPIDELEKKQEIFYIAKDSIEFELQMRKNAATRDDIYHLELRQRTALSCSYSERFQLAIGSVIEQAHKSRGNFKKLNIALIYDQIKCQKENLMKENLISFIRFSSHQIHLISATGSEIEEGLINSNKFDAVVMHYSITDFYRLPLNLLGGFKKFGGLKILLLASGQSNLEDIRSWLDQTHFELVYSDLLEQDFISMYPSYRFPATEFIFSPVDFKQCKKICSKSYTPLEAEKIALTYYSVVPNYSELKLLNKVIESSQLTNFIVSVEEKTDISSLEKYLEKTKTAFIDLKAGSDSEKKDYVSCFDFLMLRNPEIFIAIKTFTAIVVLASRKTLHLRPDYHCIVLHDDLSNLSEVLRKISDDEFVSWITLNAHNDFCMAGIHNDPNIIASIDHEVSKRITHTITETRFSTGIDEFFSNHDSAPFNPIAERGNLAVVGGYLKYDKFRKNLLNILFYAMRYSIIRKKSYWILSILPQAVSNKLVMYYLRISK